ncbi:MAG: hypothetical protein QOK42_2450 [Frankiaceae bacterium]|nr:hypothetical protein [Frankiaceae bacterium]MDX6273309.1 hypothetical protein [Frankiales bacterium]
MPRTRPLFALVGAAAAVSLALVAAPGQASGPGFTAPQRLTVDPEAGGYEPGVIVDPAGTVLVTAHKENTTLALSPDSRSTTKIRSMSWVWYSKDGGKTFSDTPGLTPLMEQNLEFGDEGDLAYDATGHVYFIDTNVADVTFSRWKDTNRNLVMETTRPALPAGEPVDDRPWVAAHGDGVVLYAGNEGDNQTYPLQQGGEGFGDGSGPGRYTIYMSYNHGDSFDNRGVGLKDSGWCRPAADKRKGSKVFFVGCTNDAGTMYSFVSINDGKSWSRYTMGKYKHGGVQDFPSTAIAPDGTFYLMYNEKDADGQDALMLYTSKDRGRHWSKKNILPNPGGKVGYDWFEVSPKGTLGIGYGYAPEGSKTYNIYAGTARPGGHFTTGIVDRNVPPHGDFFQIAFGPDNKLHIVWEVQRDGILGSDIYYAHSK